MSDFTLPARATWGVVATIKAPTRDTLHFAAYHLEAGARRVVIYLDAPDEVAFEALKAHPKCRVKLCDAKHWKRLTGHRPQKHQVRQSENATAAYNSQQDVEWLAHIDVDEFLVADSDIGTLLGSVSGDVQSLRIRPMELLGGGDGTAFKGFIPAGPARPELVRKLYPEHGPYLKGGFLSHVAGKVFLRTGLPDMNLRIHNIFQGDQTNPNIEDMPQIDLAHCHAGSWEEWYAHFAYRHDKGSYRADLGPALRNGESLHVYLSRLLDQGGEDALHAFYNDVAADTPALRDRLSDHGLLKRANLDLNGKLAVHFPDYVD